eukprot:TRINITY_DN2167_c0_g1_i1.p1 TRINITY_DN2167_c0_g1~~TRINITY_DN2167_c0_g1_i1.p1  ORF type:complete len:136 (+),score=10.27 TRINITY_DN2167_c0_g1_i1:331-738(+)
MSVRYAPKGRRLACGSWDNTVRVWDSKSGDCLAVIQVKHCVVSVAWSATEEQQLSTGGTDHSVRIWDIRDLQAPRLMWSADHQKLRLDGCQISNARGLSASDQLLMQQLGHTPQNNVGSGNVAVAQFLLLRKLRL